MNLMRGYFFAGCAEAEPGQDKIMGFSLRGIHKDELNMLLGEFPIKRRVRRGRIKHIWLR